MKLQIDPIIKDCDHIQCQIYVRAYEGDKCRTVTLSQLTRESLLEYIRETGAEKILLHLFGHY